MIKYYGEECIIMRKYGNKILFVLLTLIVALIVFPMLFNYVFLWDSGFSKGNTSDWFVLYGGIFGGLIGGYFTYIALLLTFNNETKKKQDQMRPRIDIPYQTFDFINDENFRNIISIELNNIGGSVAKNIECELTLQNYVEAINTLENGKENLNIELVPTKTKILSGENDIWDEKTFIKILDEDGKHVTGLGGIRKVFKPKFIGTCIPMALNHEAKSNYILENNVGQWINYIVKKRKYTSFEMNENELFELGLKVKYSSIEYGDFTDYFKLTWKHLAIIADDNGEIRFQYLLKSNLEKSETS